jgi:hypothetical protein
VIENSMIEQLERVCYIICLYTQKFSHGFFIKCIDYFSNDLKVSSITQFVTGLIHPDCVIKVAVAAVCER